MKNRTENGAPMKQTKAHMAILSLLEKASAPLGVADVLEKLPKGTADRSTVHRILVALVKRNVLREVDLRHGHTDYEMVHAKEHHHIVCRECGALEDVDCEVEALVKKITKQSKKFSVVDQHAFEMFGVCHACAKR
jgi:Fe2+ or Zn2+ uptake regulation protein